MYSSKDVQYFETIFSIAIRKATDSLTRMIGSKVVSKEAVLEFVQADAFPGILGAEGESFMCVFFTYNGDKSFGEAKDSLQGVVLLVFDLNSADEVANILTSGFTVPEESKKELLSSSLGEFGNVLTNGVLTILSGISGYRLSSSTPKIHQLRGMDVLPYTVDNLKIISDQIILIKTDIVNESHCVKGRFFIFPKDYKAFRNMVLLTD